jgi:transposase
VSGPSGQGWLGALLAKWVGEADRGLFFPSRLDIIKRSDKAKGFEVLPRRWVVERTFAWLNRNRRLAKDFEHTIASAAAWLFLASIQLLIRRIARLRNYHG